ncbi:hypothetical protein BC833DRAFT_257954 [Globomyces pollinis-pini]|nr:hypothetical protein BC833DRAFT_257954 [Globomyces pollinis-pini]
MDTQRQQLCLIKVAYKLQCINSDNIPRNTPNNHTISNFCHVDVKNIPKEHTRCQLDDTGEKWLRFLNTYCPYRYGCYSYRTYPWFSSVDQFWFDYFVI